MTKRALLIGINYRGQDGELGGCINDVKAVKKMLVNRFKYNPRRVLMLTDDTKKKPTRRNILRYLRWFARKLRRGDTFYLHYSGHGSRAWDRQGDEPDRFDETIVPIDMKDITDDELNNLFLKRLRRGVKVFAVVDACHSGTAMDLPYNYRFEGSHARTAFKGGVREVGSDSGETSDDESNDGEPIREGEEHRGTAHVKLVKRSRGRAQRRRPPRARVVMISGCRDYQTSADAYIDGRYQGALTAHLLKVLNKYRSKPPSLKSLMTGIHALLENEYEQEPQLSAGHRLKLHRHRFNL